MRIKVITIKIMIIDNDSNYKDNNDNAHDNN